MEDSSPCTSTPQWVFTIPSGSKNQDYSCTYPLGVEHANTIENGRDSDRERDQGQPEARASPEKVEKEVKKTRWISHPEKFEARAPDGHHIDYIRLLFVGLARKSNLVCFFVFFFFFSDFRISRHSAFAYKWQNRFWDSEPIIAHFPSNKARTSDIRIPQLFRVVPRSLYAWCVSCAWVRLEPYVETKCFVSYSSESVSKTHESKERHL